MKKISIDIEKGSNGGYVIKWYKFIPNQLQKFGGSKEEIEQLAFSNSQSVVEWIDTVSKML